MMTFGSLFDGIGCFTSGLVRAGLTPKWLVELEPDCRRVTARHFPGVPQYADVREVGGHCLEPVDLVVGGSPCQDWSVAGKRGGLAGQRAPLFRELVRVAREVRASWLVWENVPGVLSQHKGQDFAHVLSEFTGFMPEVPKKGWLNAGCCWGPLGSACWRVLDARHFGVAQRRRRVFAVVRLGDGAGLDFTRDEPHANRLRGLPAQILLEPESCYRDSAAGREAGTGTAPAVRPGARRASGSGERLTVGTFRPGSEKPKAANQYVEGVSLPLTTVYRDCLLFQANGAGSFRAGSPSLSAGDDNGSNHVVCSEVAQPVRTNVCNNSDAGMEAKGLIAHTLRAEGADASEDGTGRGTPLTIDTLPDANIEWRPVMDWSDYEVSDSGIVRKRVTGKIVKQQLAPNGYLRVNLKAGEKKAIVGVHRLVLLAFVGEPPTPEHVAAHGDGCRTNNLLSNLRWATASENQLDAVRHGTSGGFKTKGECNGSSKLTAADVEDIRRRVAQGESKKAVAESHGVSPKAVRMIVSGERWKHTLSGQVVSQVTPFDMRQASRGETMTNNRPEGSTGGAPGTGVGEPGDPSPSLAETHTPAVAYTLHGNQDECAAVATADDTAQCLRTRPPGTIENSSTTVVAYAQNQRNEVRDLAGLAGALASQPGMKQQTFVAAIQDGRDIDKAQNGLGVSEDGIAYTLDTTGAQSVAHAPAAYTELGEVHQTYRPTDVAVGMRTNAGGGGTLANVVAFGISSDAVDRSGEGRGQNAAERAGLGIVEDASPSIRARPNNSVAHGMVVRRLTPTECERLQGLPDDWTAGQSDSARYRQIGNGGAVPVMEWLGRRILEANP